MLVGGLEGGSIRLAVGGGGGGGGGGGVSSRRKTWVKVLWHAMQASPLPPSSPTSLSEHPPLRADMRESYMHNDENITEKILKILTYPKRTIDAHCHRRKDLRIYVKIYIKSATPN